MVIKRDWPNLHHSVDEVMCRWPGTIALFNRQRMKCVGCPVASFHTIAEAAAEYDLSLAAFLSELRAIAMRQPERNTAQVR